MNHDQFDWIILPFIIISIAVFESLITLLSILKNGVYVDQRKLLMTKTNKELRSMLVGVKRVSNLRKFELVELLVN